MNLVKNAELSPNNRRKRSSQSSKLAFKKTLKLGTALGAIAWAGYGRGAYAADTLNSSSTSTVYINGPGQVVTGSGFSVDTTGYGGPAIIISNGGGDVSFTHSYNGKIVGDSGIQADISDGAITITTTGDVEGTVEYGIVVIDDVDGAAITIEAGNVTGGSDGIFAESYSYLGNAGNVTITANGDVTGGDDGIFARSYSYDGYAGNVTVTANGDVTGGRYGIFARSYSYNGYAGNVTVTANGDVTGGTDGIFAEYDYYYGGGVFAESYSYLGNAGNVTVTANGDVTGRGEAKGIYAESYSYLGNAGNVTITANGDVTGGSDGIYAASVSYDGNAGDVTITANGDVTGGVYGIGIRGGSFSYGGDAGNVTITANGDVTSGSDGIFARSSSYFGYAAGNVTVTANGDVTGGDDGIDARSYSYFSNAGDVTITANGDVTSGNYGIAARSSSYYVYAAGNVTITANNVSGGYIGIYGTSISGSATSGDVTITANDVTGGVYGIAARSYSDGYNAGNITVTANDVTGGDFGIGAVSRGDLSSYDVTIVANNVTGGGIAVFGVSYSDGELGGSGDVTISVNDAIGGSYGIGAITQDGTVSVTTNGTVSGAIQAMDLTGGMVDLNLNAGSVIIGEIELDSADGTNSTLNFGEGLTAVVQFDNADGEMPNTITSPDDNHIVDGNLVYVVDGASLDSAQASRQQMNTATNGLVQSALNNRAGLTIPNGTNVRISSRGSGSTSTTWGTLLGSGVNQPATDDIAAYTGSAAALIMGVDYDAQSGFFGGLSTGQISSDDGAGFETQQKGIYAGLYRDLGNGSELSFSLGATETKSERNVAGLSGLEIAAAQYNSVVINASYTKSDIFDDLDLRLSYTGTFTEGYAETGSSGNLTVEDGSTNTLAARVQKSMPVDQGSLRFGVDVLSTTGQGGGITLAGQTLDVESLDTGVTSRAFLGLDMDNVIAEIGVDNNGRTDATMSVKFSF